MISHAFKVGGISATLVLALGLLGTYLPAKAGTADLDGRFSISEGGDATYTLPLVVPPGAGGLEPKLSLTYNSQSGNGTVGVGWSLSGLSMITRCPRTTAQDGVKGTVGYDPNDRFCIDGQRLIKVAGTAYGADGAEYRTERDSFSKVISYGTAGSGPAWFKVWTKSGQVLEYGNTNDSRIEAQGKPSARVWALNKASDTNSNYFTVTYFEDSTSGEYYPTRIDYTGNTTALVAPNASIQFVYETRPDLLQAYFAGSTINTTQRLKTVQSAIALVPVREYRLAYQVSGTTNRSRVSSVTECELKGNSCKPALIPNWTERTAGFTTEPNWSSDTPSYFADVNGDGRADMVYLRSDGVYVAISNGNGVNPATKWLSNFGTGQGYGDQNVTPVFVADINGDGLADVMAISTNGVLVAASNGSSFNDAQQWTASFTSVTGWTSMDTYPRTLADVNGDGRPDIVGFKNDGVYVGINLGGAFNGQVKWLPDFGTATTVAYASNSVNPRISIDVSGDGFADIVGVANDGIYVSLGNGSAFAAATKWASDFSVGAGWTTQDSYPRVFGDVNGDGLPDMIGFKSDGTYVALNTGSGFSVATKWASDFGSATSIPYATQKGFPRYAIDLNGDGRTDIVGFSANGVQVALSTGTGFLASTQWVSGFGSAAGYGATDTRQLVDLDGDGSPDVVAVRSNGVAVARSARTGPPDLVTKFAFGLGSALSVSYRPLTDPAVYLRGFGAVYPLADVTLPVYVVNSAKYPNGLGSGYTTTNYRYGSLKADNQGRGFLGFGWFEAAQVETSITTRTDYRQDWPYNGLPIRITKFFQGSSVFLSATTNIYSCLNPANGGTCSIAAGNRYFPYASKRIESSWDSNGVALPVVTTTNTFDMYGNPTAIIASIDDGTSKTTNNSYTNDTTNWLLGRLTRSSVASTIGGTPASASNGIYYFNDTISANTSNYNLKAKAIAAGWDQVALLVANVVINSGVTVSSTSTSSAAFDVGSGYITGMRLSLTNNGSIIGRGGNGGSGISISLTSWTGSISGRGGSALSTSIPITVTNNGTIAGGGGGGAAGNGYKANVPWPVGGGALQTAYAASSGGGGGAGGSTGGALGVGSGASLVVSGLAGAAGTLTTAGAGGATASCWQYATLKANPGGAGGALGQPGSAGSNYYGPQTIPGATQFGIPANPPQPGAAGAAVTNNIYVNWVATGTRLGPLR